MKKFSLIFLAVITVPVFALVAGVERLIAKLTGMTYNEVNIIVYYLLIPLSWTVMFDYITKLPLTTPMLLLVWILTLWKTRKHFRSTCDWAFLKSVDFLNCFGAFCWSLFPKSSISSTDNNEDKKKKHFKYIVSSVVICVIVPLLIYTELIYAIISRSK